ncbi:MAG: AMP-binding protein [Candidatus Thiodiazotropha sp. (ex Semelilucina semeliformis)]|nr:AMP-binding protein [Candidatus Thiodiazotropha sp. (ex Semelilucina semeliformis)]
MAKADMNGNNTQLLHHQPAQTVAFRRGQPISAEVFLLDVERAASGLPDHRYVFNLCEDRYHFMVGFAAALQRRQITLMPQNATAGAVNNLLEDFPDSYSLAEQPTGEIATSHINYKDLMQSESPLKPGSVLLEPDQTAAILFTSGSTGKPKMHPKSWDNLKTEAALALTHFPFNTHNIKSIVATVPSQHMYGLATAILFPWQGAIGIDTGRPFFPADICQALSRLPAPRVLVTTPLHLRACVAAGLDWPSIEFIISATAPLAPSLAAEAEQKMDTQVFEIYGSTETGSIAGRHTAVDASWKLYEGIAIHPHTEGCEVEGGHLTDKIMLNDLIRLNADNSFQLLGRDSDILKIAGKRASLSDLNHQLIHIPGVIDGTFLLPEGNRRENLRLSALVVAPSLTKREILQALANSIDEVFLPRPLHLVESLPRNATGKLPKSALEELLNSLRNDNQSNQENA